MKKIIIITFISIICCFSALSQNKSKKLKSPEIKQYNGLFELSNKDVISTIVSESKTPERGEFETKEEYQKRLPKPYDPSKLYYFNTKFKYKYDIDKQILTIKGGEKYKDWEMIRHKALGSFSILFQNEIINKGNYKASNEYGVSVTVEKTYYFEYVLYFELFKKWKEQYFKDNSIQIELPNLEPKLAERLSHDIEFILCVTIPSPDLCGSECYLVKKPEIDDPTDTSSFLKYAHAFLKKIIIWDKTKNELVKEIEF